MRLWNSAFLSLTCALFSYFSVDPRYTDPVVGAPPSFQQRLMELSALESETIRYEKSKKVKKKVRDRDSWNLFIIRLSKFSSSI